MVLNGLWLIFVIDTGATSHQWLHFDDMHAAGLQTCSDPMGFDRVNMQSDSYLVFYELEKGASSCVVCC